MRDKTPREAHAGWKAGKDRRNPIELLVESNAGRLPELIPIRFGRMLQSPFSFFRGAAGIMAADLATTAQSGIRVQACGDAHLLNFGGFATPERNIVFDINDLDETLPAPWEWDLKRLTASVVIAARHLELSEADAARAALATARSYREHMAEYAAMRALDVWYDAIRVKDVLAAQSVQRREIIRARIAKAESRSSPEFLFPKLVEHRGETPRIKDSPPLIFHPTAEQAPGLNSTYREQLALYRESLPEHVRVLFDRYRLCDIAIKVVGIGSVGTTCGIALFVAADNGPLFLQVKEARASVLEPYAGKSAHKNSGERVVAGQRLMQSASDIFLGWHRAPNGRDFYIRQLRDVKISPVVEDWDVGLLRDYGKLCAWALAKAHARSGDSAEITGYLGGGAAFDEAVCSFALAYAEQNLRDYRAFVKAVRNGQIKAALDL